MEKIKPYFPILEWAPKYQKPYIVRDLIAGITVALTVVPQVSFTQVAKTVVYFSKKKQKVNIWTVNYSLSCVKTVLPVQYYLRTQSVLLHLIFSVFNNYKKYIYLNFKGLAYASLAHLPTEYGLYTSYLSAIIYTFLGSSKDLAVGPQSLMSLLTAEYCMRPEHWMPMEGAGAG